MDKRNIELKDIRHGGFRTIPESSFKESDLILAVGLEKLPLVAESDYTLTSFWVSEQLVQKCKERDLILRLNSYCLYEAVKNPYGKAKS